MEPEAIRRDGDDVLVRVLVVPNASTTTIVGRHADRIRLRVVAPPEKGRANAAVCSLLGSVTGTKIVSIDSGMTNRNKTVRLSAMSMEDVVHSLGLDA